MPENFEAHIVIDADNLSVIDCLSQHVELGKQQIKRSMQNGAAWLETSRGIDRVRRAKKILTKGDVLHFYYNKAIQQSTPPEAKLIDDQGDYSIWYKPAGMYSQGSKWGDHCSINRWVEAHLKPQRPAFIVHRLDRATQGLMILAHKKKIATAFSKMFELRKIRKLYHAQVEGDFRPGTLPFLIDQPLDEKESMTEVLSARYCSESNSTEVLLRIITGRKHQIRRHLSLAGHPVVGDRQYGSSRCDQDLRLSCVEIGFDCPKTGEAKSWSIEKTFEDI